MTYDSLAVVSKIWLLVIATVLSFSGVLNNVCAAAQQCSGDNSMMAQQVLNRAAQALGGKERLQRIESIYTRSKIEVSGLKGVAEEWQKSNGQRKEKIDLGNVYKNTTIFNGQSGWIVDQHDYVSNLTGASLKEQILSTYLGSFSYLISGRVPGCVAEVSEDQNHQLYVLRIVPQGGYPALLYL